MDCEYLSPLQTGKSPEESPEYSEQEVSKALSLSKRALQDTIFCVTTN